MVEKTAMEADIPLTKRSAMVLRHMLEDTRKSYYTLGLAETLEANSGTVNVLLHRMADAGWMSSTWEETKQPKGRGGPPRRLFKFLPGASKVARKALERAEF